MLRIVLSSAVVFFAAPLAAPACPFCSAPSLTLSEQVAETDAVALVQWVEATKPTEESAGRTKYEIVDVGKGSASRTLRRLAWSTARL